MKRSWVLGVVTAALLGGCGSQDAIGEATEEQVGSTEDELATAIDTRRSLAVTDAAILAAFPMEEVFSQLAAHGGAGQTALSLFRQLWDTQNPGPGLGFGPHCDDDGGVLNGFTYACRPGEGAQAAADPFVDVETNPNAYLPIGLFNRWDLAPKDGAHCGEHRVVYAKRSGISNFKDRVLVIFEAVVPNPRADLGIEGCRPVADFWRGLSAISDPAARAAALHSFYFEGLPGFPPVVHPDNLGAGTDRPTGQVRTNQFMQSPWTLREFKLRKQSGDLVFTPTTVKGNPFGGLFTPGSSLAQAAAFQSYFPSQVASLAVNDLNGFGYQVPEQFNVGQSDEAAGVDDYVASFGDGGALKSAIQAKLDALGSTLTPKDIIARAKATSCGGCHRLSNGADLGGGLTWPSSLGFTHVTERTTEDGPDGARFALSPALVDVFLPARQAHFERFFVPSFNEAYTFSGDLGGPADWSDDDFWDTLAFPDLNGDGRADACGHVDGGIRCAISLGNGFGPAKLWVDSKGAAWKAIPGHEKPLAFADVNGDGKADLCGRAGGGVWCAISTGNGLAAPAMWSSDYDDLKGWNGHESNWKTIRFPDVNGDGKADVCGRSGNGIRCALSTGGGFAPSTLWTSGFSDAAGWKADPTYWKTIRFPDLNGDGKADICGRRGDGLWCGVSSGAAFTGVSRWSTGYDDAAGWKYNGWKTIAFADVDGDAKADVCGRTQSGIWCARSTGAAFQAAALWGSGYAGGAAAWESPRYADLDGDGKFDVCARGAGGIWCARSQGTGFEAATQWGSNYDGSDDAAYAEITRFPDVNGDGKADVCGRGSDGLWCALSKGSP